MGAREIRATHATIAALRTIDATMSGHPITASVVVGVAAEVAHARTMKGPMSDQNTAHAIVNAIMITDRAVGTSLESRYNSGNRSSPNRYEESQQRRRGGGDENPLGQPSPEKSASRVAGDENYEKHLNLSHTPRSL